MKRASLNVGSASTTRLPALERDGQYREADSYQGSGIIVYLNIDIVVSPRTNQTPMHSHRSCSRLGVRCPPSVNIAHVLTTACPDEAVPAMFMRPS